MKQRGKQFKDAIRIGMDQVIVEANLGCIPYRYARNYVELMDEIVDRFQEELDNGRQCNAEYSSVQEGEG